MDPRIDETKYLPLNTIKTSKARLRLSETDTQVDQDFMSQLICPANCDIRSNPFERAQIGSKSINEFLTNDKFKRRRHCLLFLQTAIKIERGNVQIRNSYRFNQTRMSDGLLNGKLVIRCSPSKLAFYAINQVLKKNFELIESKEVAKKTKIDDIVATLIKTID